jgi:hypothetical protein
LGVAHPNFALEQKLEQSLNVERWAQHVNGKVVERAKHHQIFQEN